MSYYDKQDIELTRNSIYDKKLWFVSEKEKG